jgi:hypothetical protein
MQTILLLSLRQRGWSRRLPLLMGSKAGSKFFPYRASSPENRFTLFRTHSGGHYMAISRVSSRGQREKLE